jgi:methionyl-tRNA formyltransferase
VKLSHASTISRRARNMTGDATFAPILKKEDGLIDWSHSAFGY